MDNKTKIKVLELSFNIMENILMSKNFQNKEEVMAAIKKAVEISQNEEKMPIQLKLAYAEAYKKLSSLSWEELCEIKDIISED